MPTPRTLPARFLRAAASTADLRGFDLDPWLSRLGIDPRLLFDDRSRITVDQASRMMRELWRQTDDELFGLGTHRAPRGTFRILCLATLSAPDLQTVLRRWSDFSRVLPGLPVFELSVNTTSTRIEIAMDDERDPAHFMIDVFLAVALRYLSWLVGQRLLIEQVHLPYPAPEHAEDYEVVFGPRLVFDQPVAAVVLNNDVLTVPVIRSEPEVERWLREAPRDLLTQREHGTTVADQARRILERGLRGEPVGPDDVAARLNMSTQHLRRLLREQGTSLSVIKEDLLRDAAIASLVRGNESVTDLSDRLGFSEPSAFYRAFRRWTGSAPSSYRPAGSDTVDESWEH